MIVGRFAKLFLLVCLGMTQSVVLASQSSSHQNSARASGKVATAWFAGWHANKGFAVSDVNWSKYTQMTFAFAETAPSVHELSLALSGAEFLPQFVQAAKQHGVQATVSIGGWTGSRFFSTAVGSAANRTAFVKTVTDFATKHNLDGLDFDWEYPGNQGIGCNAVAPNDTPNFLLFLRELRKHPVGSKLLLTAAAATRPFTGPDGAPLASVAEFAQVFDYLAIMNYDIYGSWMPTSGPNAPLADSCVEAKYRAASAEGAVDAWSRAGFPKEKLVLGVPGYGHSFRVRKANAFTNGVSGELAVYSPFDASNVPKGDRWDVPDTDSCGSFSDHSGSITYWGLIEEGFLDERGAAKSGITRHFDQCSKTPFVYNPATETLVSYDDAESFAAKGDFISRQGLKGFAMWEAGGDYKDTLVSAIRKAAHF